MGRPKIRMNHDISRRRFLLGGACAASAGLLPGLAGRRTRGLYGGAQLGSGRPTRIAELEQLIADLVQRGTVPGAAIAVIRDAEVSWHRAFGVRDAASSAPVDERTLFEAASVSKTVFAYSVMQLCDRGVLALDTPLSRYTPDRILEGDPRLDLITARHILSHTSGLPNFRSGAEPLRIHFTPGERFQYSGEGYWYLQSVVTHLLGTVDPGECGTYEAGLKVCAGDIGDYLEANVLVPCRMGSSGYVWTDAWERHAARPHDSTGKPLTMAKPTRTDAARYAALGGLRTTALDYANFLMEVMAPRAAAPFRLSSAIRQEMLRPQVKVDQSKDWALGWQIQRTPNGTLIQHQGGQSGVQAFAAASVDRRSGYVILTNSDNGWKVFYDERFVALINNILLG